MLERTVFETFGFKIPVERANSVIDTVLLSVCTPIL